MDFIGGEWIPVGSTTLPRVPLSYKWIINDAKIFLANRGSLKSPEFSLQIPFNGASSASKSSWHLVIEKSGAVCVQGGSVSWFNLSLCQSAEATRVFSVVQCQPIREVQIPNSRLVQTSNSRQTQRVIQKVNTAIIDPKTVLISDCIFTFLHPESNKPLYSTSPPADHPQCVVNGSFKTCHTVKSIDCEEIEKYLYNGALAIQVKATLLCIGDPVETTESCVVPPDTIREQIHSSYKDKLLTNVTLKCGEQEFMVHKVILASQSPVFKKMFEVDMKEKRSGVVDISDLSLSAASDLVSFLYTGFSPNVSTLAMELLNAAKKYELPRLYTICENELKMKIQVSNVVDTLILADLYGASSLKLACLKFIHLNLVGVQKTSQWRDLQEQSVLLMEILEYKPMQISSKPIIWD